MPLRPTKIQLILLCFLVVMTSCIPLKDVKYIQPDEQLKLNENGMIAFNRPEYHIQANDMINIRVSTRDGISLQELRDFTNTSAGGTNSLGGKSVRVQEDGNIELPRIGKIHLEGKTMDEAREAVESEFYKIYEPSAAYIEVNMPGINFTIIGEAASGNYFVQQYDFNLIEAFAMAGNLTPVADRNHIQILRTTPEGTQRAVVDITKESVMNSEYFWLQPNDVIIINPRRQKQWGIGINPIQTITTIFGGIAAIIGIYFFFKNL
ncbi:polysaccharide biosynthesis/export family protein [Moheibacter sp. BDHS18]|uniref:Polysaccharide biosynthesis/export family protein n=1 Tax=Moheibacter lacus TaxID=2745851 RepID=A0A838ZQR5_9FLAO|nr:polysaccharide biosynthesis/export family protein [Moheibacter lacus]